MTAETPSRPLHAPLDEYVRQFEDLKRDARLLTEGLSDPQLSWSSAPGRWSMAQCLDHLNSVAGPYARALEAGIATARAQGRRAAGPVRYSFLERWMIRSMEPPPRRRLPAPAMFQPAEAPRSVEGAGVIADYQALKDRFIELLASADGLDVGGVKIASPVTRLLRFRLGAAFAFVAAHERRHLWQARQVRESSDFPGPEPEPTA